MKTVIVGAGEVGSHLAKMLRAEGGEVTVIDNDAGRLSGLETSSDVEVILGDPSRPSVMRKSGIDKADLFIAVYPNSSQEINIIGAILAKQLGASRVIARINEEEYLNAENKLLFKEMGIDLLFYPEKSAADEIVEFLKHSSTAETTEFGRGRLRLSVFRLNEEAPVLDLRMSEFIDKVGQEGIKQLRVIAISHNGQTIIPRTDTKFMYSDVVYAIATKAGEELLYSQFGKSDINIRRILVIGGGAISEMLARTLCNHGVDVKIIEKDKDVCMGLKERLPEQVSIINGDGRNSDFLFEEGIHDYDAFVALTGSDESNILSCIAARKFGVLRTVAEVENIEYQHLAEEMGIDCVINKKKLTAGRIFKFTLSGRARLVRYLSGTDAEVIEYTVAPGSQITKGPLKDIGFPGNAIIGGVIRGEDAFIAVGSTIIEPYDRVAVFAFPESIKSIDRFFK